jgi:hypothetical protein
METEGRYCPSCGTPLVGATCRMCGAPLVAGARFCTQCGESVERQRVSRVPWYIAGIATVGLVLALVFPVLRGGTTPDPATAPFAGTGSMEPGSGGAPPPLTGTPREQADRLFNRVMQEREAGNMDQATFFLPMAIQAYQQAGQLDADGLYHLSILQNANRDFADARRTAEQILASQPDHLLGLYAAASAAAQGGDSTAARNYYQRFLDRFDAEKARPLSEYLDHARILPAYRDSAQQFVSRG